MQKYVNLVDLVKSFPTSIYLQKSTSIQPRTSLSKFGGKFSSFFMRLLRHHDDHDDDDVERWRDNYDYHFNATRRASRALLIDGWEEGRGNGMVRKMFFLAICLNIPEILAKHSWSFWNYISNACAAGRGDNFFNYTN